MRNERRGLSATADGNEGKRTITTHCWNKRQKRMIVIPIRGLLVDDPSALLAFRFIANQHPPTTRHLSPFRTVPSTKFALVHIVRTSTSDRPRNRSRPLSHHLLDLDDVVFARGEVGLVVNEGSLSERGLLVDTLRCMLLII